jgi:type IV secretion system protein VirB5
MNPFKGPPRLGATPVPETPYQRAGQAWDERLGTWRAQAAGWRLMAVGLLMTNTALGGSLAWLATRGSVTPWIVQVDHLGEPGVVAPAVQGVRPTDPMIAWSLARWIEGVRSLPADPVVLGEAWRRAYDFVDDAGAIALSDHARGADPFGQVGKVQVTVEVSSVVRASPDSFRIAWIERRYENGQLAATERWSGILTLALRPPRTLDGLRKNPMGIFIHSIGWSKEFTS